MEEPHQTNPVDPPAQEPQRDDAPLESQPSGTQIHPEENGQAQDAEHLEPPSADTKMDVGAGTESQEAGQGDQTADKIITNGDGNGATTELPNGEDKVVSASQGLAELDLDPAATLHTAQTAGLDLFDEEPFPAMAGYPLMDPESSLFMEPAELEDGPPKIRAFAKVEFEDGQYYINTYAVELGRDVRAAKRAQQRQFQREVVKRDRRRRGSDSSDEPSQYGYRRYAASSAVSESGGIVNFESLERRPRKKSKSTRATSPTSSSFSHSRNNSIAEPPEVVDYQALAYERLLGSGSGAANDPASYVPSPDDVPLIPVHPPTNEDQPGAGYGGISRRHARIAYNFEANCFEFETIGRNGGFVDEIWLAKGERAALDHGSKIQIGGVTMIFLLPNRGFTGTENTLVSEALSAMSFEFEDGRGESIPMIDSSASPSSEELPVDQGSVSGDSDEDEDGASGDAGDQSEGDEQSDLGEDDKEPGSRKVSGSRLHKSKGIHRHTKAPKIKLKLKSRRPHTENEADEKTKPKSKPSAPVEREKPPKPEQATLEDIATKLGVSVEELPTRRKGPGRPPKDGIMSKREYAQLVRQQKERQKAEGLQNGTFKAGKTVNGLGAGPVPEKRKYTKRKKPDEEGDDPNSVRESIEGGDDGNSSSRPAAKPAKEKQSTKPPRSPSPVFDEATLTPEQLAKPTQSYVVLIHEALSNSPTGQMSLPQIYRAIERRYPYYKLRVTTQGWQSSVRHNLSQHAAFRKIEKDGKGWMWGLVPEVSIEKEKKRRPSPPPVPQPNFYPAAPNQPYRPNQYPYAGPSGAGANQTPPQVPYPYAAPAPGYPASIPDVARGYTGPLIPGQGMTPTTYQSPYTPAPSAPVAPQPAPPYPGNHPAPHNPGVSNPYYTSTTHGRAAPNSVPAPQQATFTSPYQGPSTASKAFSTTRTGVPQPIMDACSNFKTKLMEQLTSTPTIGDTIDKALNRVLSSIIDGDSSDSTVDDPIEKIFVDEARPVIEGIWRSSGQTQAPQQSVPPAETASTATASEEQASTPTNGTAAVATESSTDGGEGSTNGTAASDSAKVSAAPLEQHQQTPIQNLLQQLGQTASASAQEKPEGDPESPKASAAANGTSAPTQRSQVMTASREAAEKAITALNVSTKRGYEDDEAVEETKEGASEEGVKEERPSKRMAV